VCSTMVASDRTESVHLAAGQGVGVAAGPEEHLETKVRAAVAI